MPVKNGNACDDDTSSITSEDALCELLGLQSLNFPVDCKEEDDDDDCCNDQIDHHPTPKKCESVGDLVRVSDTFIEKVIEKYEANITYNTSHVCILPNELSVPSSIMRRLTDELVWGGNDRDTKHLLGVDRTYETIQYYNIKDETTQERSILTRLENLNGHSGWYDLCNHYIQRCVSRIYGEEMMLYKTKLNIKPPGGSGFAPHIDTPSLIVPFGNTGPQNFVTVMIAIDDMTVKNGCLRVVGNANSCCPTISPDLDGNPDSTGRAGAIPIEIADGMNFEDLCCTAGTICIFGGWVPHRSSANGSNFARRAVFLTYNPVNEGDYYDLYYQRMNQLRNRWKDSSIPMMNPGSLEQDPEIEALATIPRI